MPAYLHSYGRQICEQMRKLFDVVHESCRTGLRKPDPKAYMQMLVALKLDKDPECVVFLDDIGGNLKSAKEVVRPRKVPYLITISVETAGLQRNLYGSGNCRVFRRFRWKLQVCMGKYCVFSPLHACAASCSNHSKRYSLPAMTQDSGPYSLAQLNIFTFLILVPIRGQILTEIMQFQLYDWCFVVQGISTIKVQDPSAAIKELETLLSFP